MQWYKYRAGSFILCLSIFFGCGQAPRFQSPALVLFASMPDATICETIAASDLIEDTFSVDYDYLCNKGGLGTMRSQGFYSIAATNDNGISNLYFGSYQRLEASLKSAVSLSREFCLNFQHYREISVDAFTQIDDIKTSQVSDAGCDYHFYGKKMLFYKPEYLGKIEYLSALSPDMFVMADYFVETISMIKDIRSLSIYIQDGKFIDFYKLGYMRVENKGFHQKAYDEFMNGAEALREGIALHINEY